MLPRRLSKWLAVDLFSDDGESRLVEAVHQREEPCFAASA